MLSVLVWLAMQGQVQTPDLSQLTDPGIVRPSPQLSKCIDNGDDTTTCPNSLLRVIIDHVELPKPKPAEHVIEIKTVRETRKVKSWADCGADEYIGSYYDQDGARVGYLCAASNVTRELWIDGVRWGVVKGLE